MSSAFIALLVGAASPASAQERLCDTQYENCGAHLLNLIQNEQIGIDVAFWFMNEYSTRDAIIAAHQRGVPVRVLVDARANNSHPYNAPMLDGLSSSGVPMRAKVTNDILHFKMMLFHGQNVVQFSKANYSWESLGPIQPNVNYVDEAFYFTNDDRLTNSFRRRFDDLWTDTWQYQNYANITGTPVRRYPLYDIHPAMNFVPLQDFSDRSVSRYDAEPTGGRIDATVFRNTDHRQADGMIRAVARGVHVRLLTEPGEYRNPVRVWHSKHIDRMYMGGVQIKHRQHQGFLHQASVVLHGLGEVIFGSSNWTTASAGYQDEHNFFYDPTFNKPWFFQWFRDQFERKWNDTANYVPFQPLPPGVPANVAPANGSSGHSTSVALTWDGGNWAHLYDIYLGTTTNPSLIASNVELGSPLTGYNEDFTVNGLLPGTTYYWRVVGKTWAQLVANGPLWSFTTGGTPPGGGGGGGGGGGSTPYGGTPAAIPGAFEAENFDEGGLGVAYHDTTAGNKGGSYRGTDVDVGPVADAGGGYHVGWTRAGEWLQYTVNVASTATYTLETRIANVGTGATFHVEVDGVNRSGSIAVPNTGDWDAWQTLVTPGIAIDAGQRKIRIVLDSLGTGGAVGGFNWFRLSTSGSAPPPPPPSPAYGGTPAAIPGVFEAENFDEGGSGVAYFDTTSGNKGGWYRNTDVDLGPISDTGGGYHVGWTRAGEWLQYTVNVTAAGTYTLDTRVANIGTGATFHVEVDGVNRTGTIAVPHTGGWDTWQTISTPGISLSAGQHVIRIVLDTIGTGGAVGGFNWFRLR